MKYNVSIKRSRINKVWAGFAGRFGDVGTAKAIIERDNPLNIIRVGKGDPLDVLKRKDCLFTLAEIENEVVPNLSELKLSGEEDIRIKDLRIVPNPEA